MVSPRIALDRSMGRSGSSAGPVRSHEDEMGRKGASRLSASHNVCSISAGLAEKTRRERAGAAWHRQWQTVGRGCVHHSDSGPQGRRARCADACEPIARPRPCRREFGPAAALSGCSISRPAALSHWVTGLGATAEPAWACSRAENSRSWRREMTTSSSPAGPEHPRATWMARALSRGSAGGGGPDG